MNKLIEFLQKLSEAKYDYERLGYKDVMDYLENGEYCHRYNSGYKDGQKDLAKKILDELTNPKNKV